jgi:hypothetical protein
MENLIFKNNYQTLPSGGFFLSSIMFSNKHKLECPVLYQLQIIFDVFYIVDISRHACFFICLRIVARSNTLARGATSVN